jgi:Tol biopolymer transport system component
MAATNAGVILGTAAYMSPEQARGRKADPRSDVFSFGCVLYEILTGRQAFQGEEVSDILASVLKDQPDFGLLRANLNPRLSELLRRCLDKNPKNRWHCAGDLRIEIDNVLANPTAQELVTAHDAGGTGKRERLAWAIAVGLGVALAIISVFHFNGTLPSEAPEIRLQVVTPPTPSTIDPFSLAISPDGRRLVFLALTEGKSQLWVRSLDSLAAQPLAGTEGASYPFWSPDGASLGFFADVKLKRINIAGGAPQELVGVAGGRGGAWNQEGVILFAPVEGPLLKVPATGGESVAVTRLETGQSAHEFPQFLPDGHHFIYFVKSRTAQGVYVGSLDGGSSRQIANADASATVSFSGYLFFPRQTTLFAQAFDFKKQEFSGNPFTVAEEVAFNAVTQAVGFSAASGIMAYRTRGVGATRQLTWLDRSGKAVGTVGALDTAGFSNVELSPDGKRVAVHRKVNGNSDIWLIDSARSVPTRFTFDPAGDSWPIWSPDGSRVMFQSNRKGVFNLYWKPSSGAGDDELLLESDQSKLPCDWSADGRFLLFRSTDPQTGWDLWVLPTSGEKKPFPFLKTPFAERDGQFSPDGKWIAYQSDESGRSEIYARPFPGPGGNFQISSNGGAQARWNKNGKEIFYVSLDSKMMAAPVKLSSDGQSVETGTPAALFPVRIVGGPESSVGRQEYAVSSDGLRFLVNLAVDEGTTSPITIIYNWHPKATK